MMMTIDDALAMALKLRDDATARNHEQETDATEEWQRFATVVVDSLSRVRALEAQLTRAAPVLGAVMAYRKRRREAVTYGQQLAADAVFVDEELPPACEAYEAHDAGPNDDCMRITVFSRWESHQQHKHPECASIAMTQTFTRRGATIDEIAMAPLGTFASSATWRSRLSELFDCWDQNPVRYIPPEPAPPPPELLQVGRYTPDMDAAHRRGEELARKVASAMDPDLTAAREEERSAWFQLRQQIARRPLPSEMLVGALHDRVHEESGRLRAAHPIRLAPPPLVRLGSLPVGERYAYKGEPDGRRARETLYPGRLNGESVIYVRRVGEGFDSRTRGTEGFDTPELPVQWLSAPPNWRDDPKYRDVEDVSNAVR